MNSIMIISALCRTPMLNNCISSVLNSDYIGNIIVTSCDPDTGYISNLSDRIEFSYQPGNSTDNPRWSLINNCIISIDKDYHDLILIHDDIIMPDVWYSRVMDAWNLAEEFAWSISLSHVEHDTIPDSSRYRDYISSHCYNDIRKEFRNYEIRYSVQVNEHPYLLGLGVDSWDTGRGFISTGRWSPVFSILHRVFRDSILKYGSDNIFVMELFMLRDMIKEKRWPLFVTGRPAVHCRNLTHKDGELDIGAGHAACYRKFHSICGYNLEHLLTIFSCMVTVEHREEIIEVINNGNHKDIEYIFDIMIEDLANRDCSKCRGLSTCRCQGKINSIGWGQ